MTELPVMMPASPEIFLACAAMAMMMVGVFVKAENAYRVVSTLAIVALVFAGGLVLHVGGGRQEALFGFFVVDDFAVFMKVLILIGSVVALIMSEGYVQREKMDRFEFPILVTFATLGMLMMVSANDLLSLYIGLELQSLSLYVVASFQRDSIRSTESGLKYFVLGALSSGLLLYGCSLIYGFSGTTQFDTLALALTGDDTSKGLIVGIVFLIAALAFKVSAVPFHMWTPDVYEGAPTPVTAFFAVAPKIAAMALFLRTMLGPFGDLVADWGQIIWLVSVASMLLGAFAAIAQSNIKRLMAYSSIGHIGYALMGLAAGNEEGLKGVLIYLAIYLIMNVGVFACILSMKVQNRMVENITDLAGLGKSNPAMAVLLMVLMFSMAGIPPMAGFFGKFFVFMAALNAELYALAIIGAVSSVVGAFYYLRIIKIMYFDEPVEAFDKVETMGLRGVMIVSGLLTAVLFIYLPGITDPATAAAASLFGG
ncbi:NADH-quinone oxidoreductase subunit NuoN [Hwanghaeella grinnelliae]|uniref:NADH-quinone oxidoreductase subunit N n=1 Tax=Hwanghaeella grinnelliae TaxID=2500179 RepID=A0A3S2VS83_9PROT|nr:NADH-quinone oxidoreductase subunit NuoN [Hwanghaeella grinnelliae]RVU39302.1 NADH-quinone oxidoreductase subunit NuoN [Hwanghaeella grinnelliae]